MELEDIEHYVSIMFKICGIIDHLQASSKESIDKLMDAVATYTNVLHPMKNSNMLDFNAYCGQSI